MRCERLDPMPDARGASPTVQMNIRVPPDLHEGLRLAAGEGNATMTDLVVSALRDWLERTHPQIAAETRKHDLTFEDLVALDRKAVRLLVDAAPAEALPLALRGASDRLREHVCAAVDPERAAALRHRMVDM